MIKIINNLHVFFIPPKHWREEDEFRKAKMLVNTLLLSILFGFFYFFNTIFFEMHYIMYNMIFCVCTFSFSLILFKYGASRTIVATYFLQQHYSVQSSIFIFLRVCLDGRSHG